MDDIVIVKFSERGGHTQGDLFRFLNGKATPVASRFHMRLQIAAVRKLRNESDVLVVSNEIEDLEDVRRAHPHQFVVDAHFAFKSILVRRIPADALQEHALAGFAIPGHVGFRHSTRVQAAQQVVAVEHDRWFGILCAGTLGLLPARRVFRIRCSRLRNLGTGRGKLLSSGFIDVREFRARKLGRIDAAQLFLDPPPHFEGEVSGIRQAHPSTLRHPGE